MTKSKVDQLRYSAGIQPALCRQMPVLNLYRSQVAELYAFAAAMNYRNLSGLKYCELQSSQLQHLVSATSFRTGCQLTRDNLEPKCVGLAHGVRVFNPSRQTMRLGRLPLRGLKV